MKLLEHGQVKQMLLPEGWRENDTTGGDRHAPSLREFSPEGESDVRLCFFYRGYPFPGETGAAFKAVLESTPHSLSAREIRSLSHLLEDILNPEWFKALAIHTESLGNKTVLVVEGRWIKQDWDTYSIYVCADDNGCVVQQIYLLAPPSAFPRHIKEVKDVLKSVQWS